VPVPPPLGHLAVGTMTVQLDDAARSTAEARRYREKGPVGSTQEAGLDTEGALALAWDDAPRYGALQGADQHLTRLPQLISSVPPEWVEVPANHPPITVRVSFVVNAHGDVEAARVLDPGEPAYDQAAVETVMRWKFRPAEDAAGPTLAFLLIPFVFRAPGWDVSQAPAPRRTL
jgi:TonB family protein